MIDLMEDEDYNLEEVPEAPVRTDTPVTRGNNEYLIQSTRQ